MSNPATTADIADRWHPLSSAEQTVANALLDDAWAYLTADLSTLDARLTAVEVNPAVVVAVVCSMVLRVLRNPDGKVQESLDDYAYRRADAVADGVLYATPDELDRLSPVGSSTNAFTITPAGSDPGYAVVSDPYYPWDINP